MKFVKVSISYLCLFALLWGAGFSLWAGKDNKAIEAGCSMILKKGLKGQLFKEGIWLLNCFSLSVECLLIFAPTFTKREMQLLLCTRD